MLWQGCVALLTLALGSVAMAADMKVKAPVYKAPVPAFSWTGFYVGGHVGYIWGRTRVEDDGVVTEPGAPTEGVVGGVLAGANWQTGALVLGIEADAGWTDAHGTGLVRLITQAPNTYDLNWTSHFRGRAGYASGDWLFFVAGGIAVADLDFHEGGITRSLLNEGGKYTGWSFGGGVEHAFTPQFLGRLEYLYDDFGSKNYTAFDGGIYTVGLKGQTLRAAGIWKF
jgi:outer membrane immunogenic protein